MVEREALFEEHLIAPRGRGRLASAEHAGAAGGAACGDLIRLAVRVEGAHVAEAGFSASGCAAAQAAGSAVVELVEGAEVLSVARLTAEDVARALGGLSPARRRGRPGGGRSTSRSERRSATGAPRSRRPADAPSSR